MPILPSLGGSTPQAAVLDLALIASLTAVIVAILTPLIRLIPKLSGNAYDSVMQAEAVIVATGLILLATYSPAVFTILSLGVATGSAAIGGHRVLAKNSTP